MVGRSMRHRLRWLVLAVVLLLVAGIVVAVVRVEPKLSDARGRVDSAWTPLRPSLIARYQALTGVDLTLVAAGTQTQTVATDLHQTLASWQRSVQVDDAATQAPLANDLEALALRVKANVAASARLQGDQALTAAIATFDRALVSPPAVHAYNQAVLAYQHERTGAIHHLVAGLFGFDARPELAIAGA
jgi:hypothetical protein